MGVHRIKQLFLMGFYGDLNDLQGLAGILIGMFLGFKGI